MQIGESDAVEHNVTLQKIGEGKTLITDMQNDIVVFLI